MTRRHKKRNSDPLKELQKLEVEFLDEPLYIRKKELPRINALRASLGLPQVDVHLKAQQVQIATSPLAPSFVEATIKPKVDPHIEARQLYATYLARIDALRVYQAYADQILQAVTARPEGGGNTTPLLPLAFGNKGGPIVCDHCQKQFTVEWAAPFNDKPVAVAVEMMMDAAQGPINPYTYIAGGLVFMKEPNGTVRFYHDYRPPCWHEVQKADEKARKAWHNKRDAKEEGRVKRGLVEYFQDELGWQESQARKVAGDVVSDIFGYQVGVGVNGP